MHVSKTVMMILISGIRNQKDESFSQLSKKVNTLPTRCQVDKGVGRGWGGQLIWVELAIKPKLGSTQYQAQTKSRLSDKPECRIELSSILAHS